MTGWLGCWVSWHTVKIHLYSEGEQYPFWIFVVKVSPAFLGWLEQMILYTTLVPSPPPLSLPTSSIYIEEEGGNEEVALSLILWIGNSLLRERGIVISERYSF
jgi:hypothetical protein